MEKQEIISTIRRYFSQRPEVMFAYVFGSFAIKEVYRDIDVAVYLEDGTDILTIGLIQSELEEELRTELDVIQLNRLFAKNPALAYDIVTTGKPVANKDQKISANFKKRVFLHYFDTEKLRMSVNEAFKKRLQTGHFGQRDYA